ncbi:MAG: CYTH domain-containing protein [Draconibacterium sp.]|nr:CYTH domain-containing protein [Draconibacterium sp.]
MYEIERKFLVDRSKWNPKDIGKKMKQGYLSVVPERTVRIRIADEEAFLTIKGKSVGIKRTEFEYKIPLKEATELMKMCLDYPIEKTRYYEKRDNVIWEIDIFEDENRGLILAEVELKTETQHINLPDWIEKEVSEDYRYFNSWLSQNPFSKWK